MKLSSTQQQVITQLIRSVELPQLVRLPGGFWTTPGQDPTEVPDWWVSVQTVRAMERLGLVARVEQKEPEWRGPRQLTAAGFRAAHELGVLA